jgi:hypothetical protein
VRLVLASVETVAWDTVGSGRLHSGELFVIERHVFYFRVPTSTSVLPIRLRSYRWQLGSDDGTWTVQHRASSRERIQTAVDAYRRSTTST